MAGGSHIIDVPKSFEDQEIREIQTLNTEEMPTMEASVTAAEAPAVKAADVQQSAMETSTPVEVPPDDTIDERVFTALELQVAAIEKQLASLADMQCLLQRKLQTNSKTED